jgi:hypothetical protein
MNVRISAAAGTFVRGDENEFLHFDSVFRRQRLLQPVARVGDYAMMHGAPMPLQIRIQTGKWAAHERGPGPGETKGRDVLQQVFILSTFCGTGELWALIAHISEIARCVALWIPPHSVYQPCLLAFPRHPD